ncbi:MAG: DsrE family protein, partial [Methanobacterium sp.]|nr:DsrE family protein [Euryarchaeota archaeon]MBV1729534.1 DsrE family protein [Methanobacterium sp.]
MKTVKALGIKAPNSAILVENIIKNSAEDGLILIVSPGAEEGLEDVAKKYGFKYEVQNSGNDVAVRMTKSQIKMEELDVTGETCPGPIILVGDRLSSMAVGDHIKVTSKSCEAIEDLAISTPEMNGKVIDQGIEGDKSYVVIEKTEKKISAAAAVNRDKVLVVQSNGIGNTERAYATFIFSKAALSMGKKVTVFLLMDGVSIAKNGNAATVKHPAFDRLDKLMAESIENGAKIYVCELSAEFRGMKQKDLVEGT